jgi:hypothetical protein
MDHIFRIGDNAFVSLRRFATHLSAPRLAEILFRKSVKLLGLFRFASDGTVQTEKVWRIVQSKIDICKRKLQAARLEIVHARQSSRRRALRTSRAVSPPSIADRIGSSSA